MKLRFAIILIFYGTVLNGTGLAMEAKMYLLALESGLTILILNLQIKGWNEALIVYVLAASSNTDSIPKIVYDNGWASNGGMKNGGTYYGIQLPLGPELGGPLFFSHYSFLGINPHGLSDAYANYFTQNTAHSVINYNYCVANPQHFNGYSSMIWGLTASDDNVSGYAAHSPTNDDGVISPTAAISSLPYTPANPWMR